MDISFLFACFTDTVCDCESVGGSMTNIWENGKISRQSALFIAKVFLSHHPPSLRQSVPFENKMLPLALETNNALYRFLSLFHLYFYVFHCSHSKVHFSYSFAARLRLQTYQSQK